MSYLLWKNIHPLGEKYWRLIFFFAALLAVFVATAVPLTLARPISGVEYPAVLIPTEANLSIAKSDDVDPIVAGGTLIYTVTVQNSGPETAVNVQATDTLPAGVTFVSTNGCIEDSSGVPTCSLGDILSSGSAQYTIEVTVDAGTLGLITNQASVTSDTGDSITDDNETSEDTAVIAPTGTLTVIKQVTNDHGGPSGPANFTMNVSGNSPSQSSFPGSSAGVVVTLEPGPYSVSESVSSGYTVSYSADCSGTIAAGDNKSCTVTNNDIAPQLTVIKNVVNNFGGTAAPANFTMNVSGTDVSNSSFPGSSTGTTITLDAGSYGVTETGPAGYAGDFSAGCTGAIGIGESKSCTVTNDDIQPKLTVIKQVINNSGGTAVASQFTISVNGANVSTPTFPGDALGTTVTLNAGSFSVTETGPFGYAANYAGDCAGSIGAGEELTCTITNNDIAPELTVIKTLVNDNGGTASSANFTMVINGTNVSDGSFPGSAAGTSITMDPGSYSVTESGPSGYTGTFSAGCGGSIGIGQKKICTITNNDIAPQLKVIKHVVNFGGPHSAADFTMNVSGVDVQPGSFPGRESGTTVTLDAGSYLVTETGPAGYTAAFSAGCSGSINIAETRTCTVTNTAEPAKITVSMIADPNQIWEPGGNVEFIITVSNSGRVRPVTVTSMNDISLGDLKNECQLPRNLAAGQAFTCRYTTNINGRGGDIHHNLVTVMAEDEAANPVTGTAAADVTILDLTSSLKVTKVASKSEVLEPGEDLLFTVTAENSSELDKVNIEQVTDSVYGNLTGVCLPGGPQTLLAGQSFTCEFSGFVGGQKGDMHSNTVSVMGTDDDGKSVSGSDSEQVFIDNAPASIKVKLTARPSHIHEPGGDVTFTVVIFNESAADNVTIDQVNSDVYGDLAPACLSGGPVTFAPGENYTCSYKRYVGGAVDDEFSYKVTASGTDDDGTEISDSASETVTIFDLPSSLLVTKTATPNQVVAPGGDVTFTVTILNDSVIDNVLIEHFVDTLYPQIADNCTPAIPVLLQPGESIICQLVAYIGGEIGDTISSRAAVSGTDDDGYSTSGIADVSVAVVRIIPDYVIFLPSNWEYFSVIEKPPSR